jgi:tripartite-type tricarboxylate transporter receptor subunit TctC
MQKHVMIRTLCGFMAAFCAQWAAAAAAQESDLANFYRGKQINLYIAAAVGGGYDAYARLLAHHIADYIPGNPTIVPVNMPGAGGAIVVTHLQNVAARDGTAIAALQPGIITAPLYTDNKQFDSRALVYLGSANSEVDGCWVRSDSPIKAYKDVFAQELIVGAASPGDTTYDLPSAQNRVLGTHFKIVSGYTGNNEIYLAMDKNEVQGICGTGLPAMMSQKPDWVTGGFIKMLVQENADGSQKLNQQGIPRSADFAKSDEDRKVLDLIYAPQKFGRPFAMPPGVPAERVAALRRAFVEALQDKQLLAEAAKMNLDVQTISGQDLQDLVAQLYTTPPTIISRAKQALDFSGSK